MSQPLASPRYPEDFRQLHADGGFYYEHWHPDAPQDYDGTWPIGEEPPHYSAGLWVYDSDDQPGSKVVAWEWGFELESGPCYECGGPDQPSVQEGVEWVIEEVNRDRSFA